MKSITRFCLILIAAAALTSLPAGAQTAGPTTNAAPASPKPPRAPAFRGKISAVDSANLTLTLTRRAGPEFKVKISSKTKITKDRQPGVFADAAEGLTVSGRGTKDPDGNWEATTLRITTQSAPPAAKPAAPATGQ